MTATLFFVTNIVVLYNAYNREPQTWFCVIRQISRISKSGVFKGGISPSGLSPLALYADYPFIISSYAIYIGQEKPPDGFTCEGNAAWLNEHITFKVSDVTPKEYRNLMDWAGWNTSEPEIKEETCCNLQGVYGEVTSVTTPVTSGKVAFSGKAMSQCKLTVTAGAGVRVCRLDAYRDGVLYDTMYVAAKPYDEAGNLLDTELYTKVRRNVEQKLWTDDMSNYDKLDALADYISTTAHYPKYKCTQKEVNPTLWDSFAVDDVALYYDMFNMPVLNRAMALRGGIITCVAVDIVCAAAEEDLGLKYLYDKATDTVAEGEGVWLAIGSASTNPGAGAHESLAYKNADGDIVYIDAHGCLNKVIRD